MSVTPAAHLARLKVTFGEYWAIGRGVPRGARFIAIERATGRRITAASVPELENRLTEEGKQE